MINMNYVEECRRCQVDCHTRKALCSFCLTQKIIKGKWKMLIFWHLQEGNIRFNELNRMIPTTAATLSRQLKELERDGVIERKVFEQIPPRVEYSLSPIGQEFTKVMQAMQQWGDAYLNQLKQGNT